jgi:RNA polymerase sigma-70 factor (ECF subfamily)
MSEVARAFDHAAALAGCARGERAALRALYEQEARWLLGVAYRIVRRREVAHDVVHDAFIQIWEKSYTFDTARGSARGWIYSVVRHRALTVVRDSKYETLVDNAVIDSLLADTADSSFETLLRAPDTRALARCLTELDASKRSCILLAYLDGLSHQQIATKLQTPLGTVKAWIQRGLIALRECLS